MDDVTRRTLLAATAAGGLLAAATAGAQTAETVPQPRRPGRGGSDSGPRNLTRDRENPDLLVPPSSDYGTLPNLRFSFSDAHARLESGGWTRQVTVRELGISKDIAGVNMRLNAGDVGYVPFAMGHYIENTGTTPVRFLEVFRSNYYADVSLNQWLALTPSELVEAHLKVDPQTLAAFHKEKSPVVPT